jgi:diketogulonate reductase-like aldo/keto reductase
MANIHTPIPTLKLKDGTSVPMLAYGTGTAQSKRNVPETEVSRELVDAIKLAIKMGYRHFDCADSAYFLLPYFVHI